MTAQDSLTLTTATVNGTKVTADYTDKVGRRTRRTFTPQRMDPKGFLAWCDLRGDYRLFKAERIENVAASA